MFIIWCGLLVIVESQGQTIVNTTHGTIQGFRQTVLGRNVDTFFGIPYAAPPVGKRRFHPPVDVRSWDKEILVVNKQHASCYTIIDTSFNRMPGVEMWNPNTKMSEDCLYLNVWVPRGASLNNKHPMATLVWIFGGGFQSGTPTLDVYDGKFLAAYTDVIVVSINYRTGPLGFMYMGTEDIPGNMGLLDQQMALRWVFKNIERFGGDRNRITLFGESAGAISAGLHLYSKGSTDYFNRVILQSGIPRSYYTSTTEAAEQRAMALAINMGCPKMNTETTIECLMMKSAQEITDNQLSVNASGFVKIPFKPVIDGVFLEDSLHTLAAHGKMKRVDTLLGVVKDEGTYFLVYGLPKYFGLVHNKTLTQTDFKECLSKILSAEKENVKIAAAALYFDCVPSMYRDSYRDVLDDIFGDVQFKCPTVNFARTSSVYSDVYLYTFNERMKNLPWPEWMGVPHGYEIETVFGSPLRPTGRYTLAEVELSKRVMRYWTNFAKTGNPNGLHLPEWPKYTKSSPNYVILDSTSRDYIQSGLRSVQCTFWTTKAPLINDTESSTQTNCSHNGAYGIHEIQVFVFIQVLFSQLAF